MTSRERASALARRFRKVYPDAHCELDFKDPLQLLIATILSAQCTDKRVNMVTPALFKKYRDARAFAQAKPATFEEAKFAQLVFSEAKPKAFSAPARPSWRRTMAEFRIRWRDSVRCHIRQKRRTLCSATLLHKNEGIVVDTHVIRLSQRFKLTRHKDAEKIEQDLMKIVPRQDWTLWSHWLIWHGRRRCFARKPDCANCEVFDLCPSGKVFLRTGEAKKT